MFRKCLSGLAILIATAAVLFLNVRIQQSDVLFYRNLVQESIDLHGSSSLERSPVKQTRENVRKDIWRVEGNERVHTCIVSEHSEVTLNQKKGKVDVVEILSGVEAWVDSEEGVRHFSAGSSTYHFPLSVVTANELTADFGDMRCKANVAEWAKETLQLFGDFQLSSPKGILYGERGTLTRDGSFSCFFPFGEFETQKTLFSADVGWAEFEPNKFLPQMLILEGDVNIASNREEKESFAKADLATYRIADKKITLQSCPDGHVFFKQGGLEINAPTVYIQESIETLGDVRCHYSLEKSQ
jgi:hypothetical protein